MRREHAEPAAAGCDRPRGLVGHRLTVIAGLVGEWLMPELGVVPVGVEHRVRALRLHHLVWGMGLGQPPVVGLAGEFEQPRPPPSEGSLQRQARSPAGNLVPAGSPGTDTPPPDAKPRCSARVSGSACGLCAAWPRRSESVWAWCPRRCRHDASTSAVASGEHRNLPRSARSSLPACGSSPRAQRCHRNSLG